MLNIGILGAGAMGTDHARAYARLPGVQVTAIFSRSADHAARLAGEVGAQPLTDADALVDDPRIDAISNTLPTHLHPTYTLAALQRGKHVLLEKPMALSVEACDAMIQAAAEHDRILMIAQVLRFWPEYIAIANLVRSKKLGEPLSASARRLSARPRWGDWFANPEWTGGAVLDLHIHDLDACNWLFGRPQTVYARGRQGPGGGWDHVHTLAGYGSVSAGVEASFMLPDGHPFDYGLRVICEGGSIEFEPGKSESGRLLVYEPGRAAYPLPFQAGSGYEAEVAHFVECIQSGRAPSQGTPEQGRLAVATCLAARRSLETGQVITL